MKNWLLRIGAGGALLFVVTSAGLLADAWADFGKGAEGERLERMLASPQNEDGVFVNPQPMWNDVAGWFTSWDRYSDHSEPSEPISTRPGDRSRFASPPASGLRVTWLGHSTQLIEIDGLVVLTDPIFGGRASPFQWAGPATWYEPPIPLDQLPPVDVVLISHDHYDHLQMPTIQRMVDWDTQFVAPLGVGAHLEYWGIPPERVTELDWWEDVRVGALTVTATPSRHASGRQVLDQNHTLWASYAIVGPQHKVWFSGDTGLFPALDEIGQRLGPFDLTMVEAGAYDKTWPDWHLGPEQAIEAHQMVGGEVFMPIHWGMWDLALHGWTEPVERSVVEAERLGIPIATPQPGQSFELDDLPQDRWWPDLPWDTVEVHPVVARGWDR